MSSSDRALLQLVVSLASSGRVTDAAVHAREIVTRDVAVDAWLVLGRANANMQRWDDARSSLEHAVRLLPQSRAIALELALLAERKGDHADALGQLEALAAAGIDAPQLLGHLARALSFAGRTGDAERRLLEGLATWPTEPHLHKQLAELRWRLGHAAPTAVLESAIAAYPDAGPLRLIAAEQLRNAGERERGLAILEAGIALSPDVPWLLTSAGVLLDDLGRDAEALALQKRALALSPGSMTIRRNLVPALLRAQAFTEAMQMLEGLTAEQPDDQLLIAWRATALRLARDSAYGRLYDYARLVQVRDLATPPGFHDMHAFNRALAAELTGLHRQQQHPLGQSLRGGSQTDRNLPRDPGRHPAIAAFFALLEAPIREYISGLDARSAHPTDRRRSADFRFAGSWSVQLQPRGFHLNHVHPQGWISSAYYVELPEGMDQRATPGERAGWLQFGEPGMPRPVCGPDHFVEPRAGRLVLFPSHFWHGTVPFESGGRRLTAAFDVVPG